MGGDPFRSRAFLRQRKLWYDKLAKEGFDDIEIVDWGTGESGNLTRGNFNYRNSIRHQTSGDERYYQIAGMHLWDLIEGETDWRENRHGRTSDEVVQVWSMHAEALGTRVIAKRLGMSRGRAVEIIRYERARMLEKYAGASGE